RKRLAVRSGTNGFLDPNKLIELAAVEVLPHLEEAVDRIARIIAVADVFRDLEGAVRQVCGEPVVWDALRLPNWIGRIRLREGRIGAGRWRDGVIHIRVSPNHLLGEAEIRTR